MKKIQLLKFIRFFLKLNAITMLILFITLVFKLNLKLNLMTLFILLFSLTYIFFLFYLFSSYITANKTDIKKEYKNIEKKEKALDYLKKRKKEGKF